jgi:hypothetical protein
MKRYIYLLFTFIPFYKSYGQNSKSLEISFFGRKDIQGKYISNYGGRAYNDTTKISGYSYGLNVHFRKKIYKSYSMSFGIGYNRLKIDNIKGNMPFGLPGVRTARSINYDDGITNLGYGTTNYFYNNLASTISIDKSIYLTKSFSINISPEFIAYYTISQSYQLNQKKRWKTRNNKALEVGVNLNLGVIKEFNKFYIRPSVIVPIFQNLKGDIVFYENPKMNIEKWFNGIGLSLKIGRYIK